MAPGNARANGGRREWRSGARDGRDLRAPRALAGKVLPVEPRARIKSSLRDVGCAGARRHAACLLAHATASAVADDPMAIPIEPAVTRGARAPVRFRLRDVQLPPAESLLATLWGDQVLEGVVVAHSRASGDERCVVVKVPELDQLIVVMAADLLTVTEV
jgi:hypothetical protein